jgi:hypothetical protein
MPGAGSAGLRVEHAHGTFQPISLRMRLSFWLGRSICGDRMARLHGTGIRLERAAWFNGHFNGWRTGPNLVWQKSAYLGCGVCGNCQLSDSGAGIGITNIKHNPHDRTGHGREKEPCVVAQSNDWYLDGGTSIVSDSRVCVTG